MKGCRLGKSLAGACMGFNKRKNYLGLEGVMIFKKVRHLRPFLVQKLAGHTYYGWVVVVVIALANLASFNLSPTFGLYIAPLEAEFGWSRSEISRSLTVGTVMAIFLAPCLGYLVERFGVRVLNITFGSLTSMLLFWLTQVTTVWQFNLIFGAAFALATTGIGQLLGGLAISQWFVRRRGRAMGMIMMGASGGALFFVPLNTWIIAVSGWRLAYSMQALACVVLVVLPSFLLMVDTPQAIHAQDEEEFSRQVGGKEETESSWTLQEALASRAFWLSLTGVTLGNFCVLGYFVHAVPIMQSNGASRVVASAAWTVFFLFGVVAKFFWGFLIERIGVRLALVALFLGEALGMLALFHSTLPAHWFMYAVGNAIVHGPFLQLMSMVWPDLFGRTHMGRIVSFGQPIVIIAGSLGPWAGGFMFDRYHDYRAFLILSIGTALLTTLVFALTKRPVKPSLV